MEKVLDILKEHVHCCNGQDWCNDLINGDEDSKRLAICLAIELRKKGEEILDLNHISEIFSVCDYDKARFLIDNSYPRKWFAERIDLIRNILRKPSCSIIESTQFISSSSNNNHYVTFLTFYRLKKYYLDNIGYYSGVDSNNASQIEDFINLFPNLLDFIEFFGDKNYPIWVSTHEEYLRVKSIDSTLSCPTNVINALGIFPDIADTAIFPDSGNMLFQINYGPEYNITTFQPSSLNKNWNNCTLDFYLSYIKNDCFGKTCACNDSNCGSKEQIHEQILCKDKGLRTSFLGKYDLIPFDKSGILNEGLKRVEI